MKHRKEDRGHGNQWADELLSSAESAERRRLADAAAGRDHRRSVRDDAPPAGDHYSNKTGHLARVLAAKGGATPRARFELSGEPDTLVPEIDYPTPEDLMPLGPVAPEDVAGFKRDAAKAERDAKKEWRAHVGSRQESGVRWNKHRREEAAQSPPLDANPEADAKELAAFQDMVTNGTAPWMAPVEPYDSLAGHVYAREARKGSRAATEAAGSAQGSKAQGLGKNRKNHRGRQNTQPPPTRGGR